MTKEVLKRQLVALEEINQLSIGENAVCLPAEIDTAMDAIKEALAQPEQDGKCKYCTDGCHACDARKLPEQEPVAWLYKSEPSFDGNKWHDTFEVTTSKQVALWKDKSAKPLYTTPPQRTWVGLTDREIDELWMSHHDDFGNPLSATGYERAIEAKLKEKNEKT